MKKLIFMMTVLLVTSTAVMAEDHVMAATRYSGNGRGPRDGGDAQRATFAG